MSIKIQSILGFLDEILKDVNITDEDFGKILDRLKSPDEGMKKRLAELGVSDDEIRKIMKVTDRDLKSIENLFK